VRAHPKQVPTEMVYVYQKNALGEYVCGQCGKTRKNQNTMHYHLKTHEGKLPFECSTCNKQFLHASTLELHKRAQHQATQDKMFKCPVKGCEFGETLTKSNLLIHYIRKHCKEEAAKSLKLESGIYTCRHCDKELKSLTSFHYHVAQCIVIQDDTQRAHLVAIRGL